MLIRLNKEGRRQYRLLVTNKIVREFSEYRQDFTLYVKGEIIEHIIFSAVLGFIIGETFSASPVNSIVGLGIFLYIFGLWDFIRECIKSTSSDYVFSIVVMAIGIGLILLYTGNTEYKLLLLAVLAGIAYKVSMLIISDRIENGKLRAYLIVLEE